MQYLRNTWYVATWGQDLAEGAMVPRTICDQPLVFFRAPDGSPAAIIDRCAHRFAPLHMGTLCADTGEITCPYHGLRYGSSGKCVNNPHGSGRIPAALHLASFPVIEKHSLIWVWLGDQAADPSLIPDYSHLDVDAPVQATKRDWIVMEANYQLITDNLLDLSHASFLHEGILANDEMLGAEVVIEQSDDSLTVRRFSGDVLPPRLFDLMYRNDGVRCDIWADMRWNPPSHLVNNAGITAPGAPRTEGVTILGSHLLTPATATTTYYHFAAVRIANPNIPAPDDDETIAQQLAELRRFAFEQQDRPIIEAQQQRYNQAGGLDALRPVMLSIDTGPLRARRMLAEAITAESTAS